MSSKQNTKAKIALSPKPQNTQKKKQAVPRKRNAPVAVGVSNRVTKPRMNTTNNGERLTVHHREYIRDISGSTSSFAVPESIEINPGLSASFPWLSQVASRFESYQFKKLNFEFQTESPTSTAGFLSLVPDYNATDSAPNTKGRALQYEDAVKCAPWECCTMRCSPHNIQKRKTYFTRSGAIQADEDQSLYDSGSLFVCVGGQAASSVIGELWADYSVEFNTPQIESTQGPVESAYVAGATAQTQGLPFGTAAVLTFSGETMVSYDGVTGAFTALKDFNSLLAFVKFSGTTLSAIACASTGTVVTQSAEVVNAGSTAGIEGYKITLKRGETFTLSCTAATVTAATLVLTLYAAT